MKVELQQLASTQGKLHGRTNNIFKVSVLTELSQRDRRGRKYLATDAVLYIS